jgi:hypothetical protein
MANQTQGEQPKIKQNRLVYPRSEQEWVNEHVGPALDGEVSIHDSREEAVAFAVAMVEHAGGGQVTVRGLTGEIEDQRTIRPNGLSSHVSIGRGMEEENSFTVHSSNDTDAETDDGQGKEKRSSKVRGKSKR